MSRPVRTAVTFMAVLAGGVLLAQHRPNRDVFMHFFAMEVTWK
jgi:hypothetical protein